MTCSSHTLGSIFYICRPVCHQLLQTRLIHNASLHHSAPPTTDTQICSWQRPRFAKRSATKNRYVVKSSDHRYTYWPSIKCWISRISFDLLRESFSWRWKWSRLNSAKRSKSTRVELVFSLVRSNCFCSNTPQKLDCIQIDLTARRSKRSCKSTERLLFKTNHCCAKVYC